MKTCSSLYSALVLLLSDSGMDENCMVTHFLVWHFRKSSLIHALLSLFFNAELHIFSSSFWNVFITSTMDSILKVCYLWQSWRTSANQKLLYAKYRTVITSKIFEGLQVRRKWNRHMQRKPFEVLATLHILRAIQITWNCTELH